MIRRSQRGQHRRHAQDGHRQDGDQTAQGGGAGARHPVRPRRRPRRAAADAQGGRGEAGEDIRPQRDRREGHHPQLPRRRAEGGCGGEAGDLRRDQRQRGERQLHAVQTGD